jgi:cardiolipin synthase
MASRIFTVPNQLTFLRLAFLPFFLISIWYRRFDWALGLLLAAAASDLLDGLLARRLGQKTALGAYLDPIADKLLLSSAFLALSLRGKIAWWLTILVFSRDVLILAAAIAILLTVGTRRFPPSVYGKLTTGAQMALVFVVIAGGAAQQPALDWLEVALVWVTAGLTVFSGVHYSVVIARRLHAPHA